MDSTDRHGLVWEHQQTTPTLLLDSLLGLFFLRLADIKLASITITIPITGAHGARQRHILKALSQVWAVELRRQLESAAEITPTARLLTHGTDRLGPLPSQ